MVKIEGKSVFGGVAIGPIGILKKKEKKVVRSHVDQTEEEIKRYEKASKEAEDQLQALYEKALEEVGEANADIFHVHQLMLSDMDYVESITNMIRMQNVNAEYAIAMTSDNFSTLFEMMDDDYMRARAADVKDVSNRLIHILSGREDDPLQGDVPVILAADDLAPSETVQLDKSKILAFVTRYGSANSHTAILARTMNIPAIIGADFPEDCDGKTAVVDGETGCLYIEPAPEILHQMEEKQREEQKKQEMLQTLKGKEDVTLGGKKINLYANVGNVSDVMIALKNDASGIGLFRSEFLYLEKDHYPTEEEQFQVYKTVAETMAGKKVIIRTLDIGADKQIGYFDMEPEENPAMGYRAIRICLDREDIFKTQLRALYRASAYGNIAIMYPMIISVEEVRKIKKISAQVRQQLSDAGISFGEVEEGIMIETPAAAIISDLLAEEVDFFSIGTNDLSQYTLAIDRQNPKLDTFFDPHHPAVLRLLQMVADNAHKVGIWVGICGELGADLSLTESFIRMGMDELSVSPAMVLPVRQKIRETNG
ncbi:phosphoenolpyruvate--protein phosphotransferase [Frisingicoccus sp.]|uniref:phosphoenolpyruvate--protein phosphotransferase n=1 Tax=Frisingicoccus sp. TaxID=1918627 RepID=UPI003AB5EC2B